MFAKKRGSRTRGMLAVALSLAMLCPAIALADVTAPGTLPIVTEPVEISIALTQGNFVTDYYDNHLTRLIEEKSGVKLTFDIFPSVDAADKLKLMVNSGSKLSDVLTFGIGDDQTRYLYGEAGAIIALNDYFDPETGMAAFFYQRCETVGVDANVLFGMVKSPDGKLYAMPNRSLNFSSMHAIRAWINQEWLDALELKAPTTIDELTQTLIAFRDRDPNGNGIADETPMTGVGDWTGNENPICWLQNLFVYCDAKNSRYLPLSETGGKVDVSYDKDAYREFLKYVNMLIAEELLSETCLTQSVADLRKQLQAEVETIGMMCGSANAFGDNIDAWQPLEQPAGADGVRRVTCKYSGAGACWAISANCENPDVAFRLGEMSYDGDIIPLTSRFGELGVDWKYAEEGDISVFNEAGVAPNVKVLNNVWGAGARQQALGWHGFVPLSGRHTHNGRMLRRQRTVRRAPARPLRFPE